MIKRFREGSSKTFIQGNFIDYIRNFQSKFPGLTLILGTDSQVKGKKTEFITVIVLRYQNNRGAKFIYTKNVEDRYQDDIDRLNKETHYTYYILQDLEEAGFQISQVELDYNSDKKYVSQKAVQQNRGWIEGMGYKVVIKPGKQMAVKAADWILKT